jgi:hypothetical protein
MRDSRILCCVAALTLLGAASDRAGGLPGTWLCVTGAGSTATMTYTQTAAGSMAMMNHFKDANGRTGEFEERYSFDLTSDRWSWTSTIPNDPHFKESATASAWTGEQWVFDGTMRRTIDPSPDSIALTEMVSQPIRMAYQYVDSNTFHRVFELRQNDKWLMTSTSTCERKL